MEEKMASDRAAFTRNFGGNIVVYRTENWQEEIKVVLGPMRIHDTRESWLARAARKAGITLWHTRALLTGNLTDPKWSIGIQVKNAADKVRWEAAQGDKKKLAQIYATAARGLNEIDANFHSSTVSALLALASEISPDDSA